MIFHNRVFGNQAKPACTRLNWLALLGGAALMTMSTLPASAHEYWLQQRTFTIAPGENLQGDLKNGQDFKGSSFSYIANRFDQFTVTGPSGTADVTGRNGDMPALNMPAPEAGLYSASYQGKFDRITFTDPEKLKYYIDYEGFRGILERHAERGLPETKFQEQYARCAKALFQVGAPDPGGNQDTLTGMKFELVAEKNPYALTQADFLPVRLYWEGKPMADVQIRMFRFNKELETAIVRTDAEGRASFSLAGGGRFMLNAVNLYEGDDDPETETAEWVSYWASLTFGLADTDEVLAVDSASGQ
jgi:uncharacterized GH25 family protein